MSHSTRIAAIAADESGAVLVMFAVFLPVAILLAALAIDAGNWFLHQRHLQLQADSGALAAALEFQPCSNGAIETAARQYSGIAGSPLFNAQIGGTPASNVHELINSKTYYNQSSPSDPSAVEEKPCEANMVDLKLTETNIPWYWHPLSSVSNVNAHARVEILKETTATGVSPLAVAESAPSAARAYFVNEDEANKVIASAPLKDIGPTGQGEDEWSNASTPVEVPINHPHIGVVIALSGKKNDTTCGDTYVQCFDQGGTGPLIHIAGYSNAGTGAPEKPLAREVKLSVPGTAGACTDGYFSTTTGCTFSISAKIDYGSAITKGVTITPEIGGTKEKAALTFNATTGLWTGTATLPAGSVGSKELNLVFKCAKESSSPCPTAERNATIKDVHRIYAASEEHSGPIAGAWIAAVGGLPQDANSFQECSGCAQKLVATIDVTGSLADAQKYSDPLYHLRFGRPGSEVIGCTPGGESSGAAYRENLEKGCQGKYQINTSDPSCVSKTEPYDCIGFASGVKTGPFSQGLSTRLETNPPGGTKFYCPNNWQNNNGGGVPVLPNDDSRIVQVFIEPFGSNGSTSAPIEDFAAFYVTGWQGDRCNDKTHPDDPTSGAEIVGHFIKYVNLIANEGGGKPKCKEDPLGECVAVLTR